MALVIADRVRETTTTSGTGTITLAGAYTGFQAFSVIGNGNTTYYAIVDAQTGSWEVGIGTYTLSGTTLSRDTVLASSNSGSLVNFASGTKDVICTQPAERAVFLDSATNATIPGITLSGGTANGVAYLNGSKVLTTGSALTFDGTNLGVSGNVTVGNAKYFGLDANAKYVPDDASVGGAFYTGGGFRWFLSGSESMRLNSTGLGIGTSSPGAKLEAKVDFVSSANAIFSNGQNGQTLTLANSYNYNSDGGGSAVVSTGALLLRANGNNLLLNDSGNLGLGVTPSAWNSAIKAFQIGAGVSLESRTSNYGYMALSANQYINSGGSAIYLATDAATKYDQANGVHRWFNAPSGTAGNAISFTQAMTLDASGNLLTGLTSNAGLTVGGGSVAANGVLLAKGALSDHQTSAGVLEYTSNKVSIRAYGATSGTGFIAFNTGGGGGSADTERARIDASGNLLVGRTGLINQERLGVTTATDVACSTNRESSSSYYPWVFYSNSNLVGYIQSTSTTTTYATSSDYRLKEDVQPMTGALAKVAALKPCTYKWKADGSDGEGFIAHELQAVVPQCVTGEKDAVDAEGKPMYQGIDTSFLVATLTAAIQEQQAIIDSLKARLDAANL